MKRLTKSNNQSSQTPDIEIFVCETALLMMLRKYLVKGM